MHEAEAYLRNPQNPSSNLAVAPALVECVFVGHHGI